MNNYYRITAILRMMSLFLLFSAGCAHSPQHTMGPGQQQIVVKQGETIQQISRRSGASISDIINANSIDPHKPLYAGQQINVPRRQNNRTKNQRAAKMPVFKGPKIALDWPVDKPVLFREFSEQAKNVNEGIDLGAPKNTVVKAAAAGKVLHVGDTGNNFGQTIIIRHQQPYMTVYANLGTAQVKTGDLVKSGETIGTVGTSGGVESPMVHFEVRRNRLPVNPVYFLPH